MALIKDRLNVDATMRAGRRGQFDGVVDGEVVSTRGGNWFTRQFGAGYPDFQDVVEKIKP